MESVISLLPTWVWVVIVLVTAFIAVVLGRVFSRGEIGNEPILLRVPEAGVDDKENSISHADLIAEYNTRLGRWTRRRDQVEERLGRLRSQTYEDMSLSVLLDGASAEERANLGTILRLPSESRPAQLMDELRKAGSHSVTSMLRGGHVEYDEVVRDVAVKLGARPAPKLSAFQLEREAIAAALDKMLAEATPEQRRAILEDLARSQKTSVKGLVGATGGLVAVNLTGFGLYVAASSTLAAVTGAIGLTLPFAAYASMSSVLATITGPIGWAVLAAWAVVKLGGADYKRTVPGVIAIASARARLIAERDQEAEVLIGERDGSLAQELSKLQQLNSYIEQLGDMRPGDRINRNQIPR